MHSDDVQYISNIDVAIIIQNFQAIFSTSIFIFINHTHVHIIFSIGTMVHIKVYEITI